MGEIAEMILDGTLCQECGGFVGNGPDYIEPGFPVSCRACSRK